MHLRYVALCALIVGCAVGCRFSIRVESLSVIPYVVQIQSPTTGQLSKPFYMEGKGSNATYRVRGQCLKRTYIRVYAASAADHSAQQKVFETSGFLNGNGYVQYGLLTNGVAFLRNSVGVAIAFGTFGTAPVG